MRRNSLLLIVGTACSIVWLGMSAGTAFGQDVVASGSIHYGQFPPPYIGDLCASRSGALGAGVHIGRQSGRLRWSAGYVQLLSLDRESCIFDPAHPETGTSTDRSVRTDGVLRYSHIRLAFLPERLRFVMPTGSVGFGNERDLIANAGVILGSPDQRRWNAQLGAYAIRSVENVVVREWRNGQLIASSSTDRASWRLAADVALVYRLH